MKVLLVCSLLVALSVEKGRDACRRTLEQASSPLAIQQRRKR